MEGGKKTKYFKNIFIIVTTILIITAICIIFIRNNTLAQDNNQNIREIKISKDIVIGISEFDTTNPILTNSLEVQYLTKLVYKPLIEITQDFNIEPGVAKEWSKITEKEYLIKLQEINWHNGQPVTSQDVEYTINVIKNSDSIYKENVEKIEQVEIIDDYTMKINLIEEVDFLEYLLCFPIIKEKGDNIGTGEYEIESISEEQIILNNKERKIIVKIYKTIPELYNDFSKEKVDLILTKNNEYSEYIRNIGISEKIITGRNFYYITFGNNLKKEEKNQIKNYINREQIIYELYNNKYVLAEFPLQYGSYLSKSIDIAETNGNKISQQIILGVNKRDEELYQIAKIIQKQLQQENLRVSIVNYFDFDNAVKNSYYDLIINKKTVDITPKIDYYFQNDEVKQNIIKTYKIESKEVMQEEYLKIIEDFEEELPFVGLFFNSYIVLYHSKLKGDFTGNWYNIFYNIDTWYKVE